MPLDSLARSIRSRIIRRDFSNFKCPVLSFSTIALNLALYITLTISATNGMPSTWPGIISWNRTKSKNTNCKMKNGRRTAKYVLAFVGVEHRAGQARLLRGRHQRPTPSQRAVLSLDEANRSSQQQVQVRAAPEAPVDEAGRTAAPCAGTRT